jgi:hypothetical protein
MRPSGMVILTRRYTERKSSSSSSSSSEDVEGDVPAIL